MSISNPNASGTKNPIRVFARLQGKVGSWSLYDAEKKETSEYKGAIEGIVLDSNVARIIGYNKKLGNISSGYFRSVTDEIKVYLGNDLLVKGCWGNEEVKDKIKSKNGKYSIILPLVTVKGNLMAIELKGMMMGKFFDYKKTVNLDVDPHIRIHSPYKEENDLGEYFVMKFEQGDEKKYSSEIWNKAMEHDVAFQEYMGTPVVQPLPKANAKEAEKEPSDEPDFIDQVYKDTVKNKTSGSGAQPEENWVDPNDEEDDLPF